MKVKNPRIQLDGFGKPTIDFELIPETDLERDAIKAIGTHITAGKEGLGMYCNGQTEALKVQMEQNKEKFHLWTFWQVDGKKFVRSTFTEV